MPAEELKGGKSVPKELPGADGVKHFALVPGLVVIGLAGMDYKRGVISV
jgi:hypothetical protein